MHSKQGARGRWLWTLAATATLAACFGGEGQLPVASLTTAFYALTPVTAVIGTATTFTVTGQNLPLTATLTVPDGFCLTPTNRTASGFTDVCTLGGAPGNQIITIRSDTLANNGWWIGQQSISATASASTPLTVINLLVDSGINAGQCYSANSDVLVSCLSPSAIALNDKQDGMTGRDVTSADGADGQAGLSYAVVGAYAKTDCVRDGISGLIWQGKSTALVALPGDARNLEAKGVETTTNAAGLCGFTDWRLPSRGELQSVVNYGSGDLYFAIDTNWFPDTKIGAYYSSTKYAPNLKNVWLVDFTKGSIAPDSAANSGVYVRLVR
ncbi:MAG: DUF1566 domain-containing protein [Rhodoferax sp.]